MKEDCVSCFQIEARFWMRAALFCVGFGTLSIAAPSSKAFVETDSTLSLQLTTLDGKDAQGLPIYVGAFTELVLWIGNSGPPDSIQISAYAVYLIDHLPGEKFPEKIFIGVGRDSIHIHVSPLVENINQCFSLTNTLTLSVSRKYPRSQNGPGLNIHFPCLATTEIHQGTPYLGKRNNKFPNANQSSGLSLGPRWNWGSSWFNVEGSRSK